MTPKPDDLVDSRIADAWREASSEEPAASVDAAILAAARREVSARPEALAVWQAREARASRRRWWPLAAAATVAAIAVGVLQVTPTDKLVSPTSETATVSDVPAPAAKTASGVPPPTVQADSKAAASAPAAEPPPPAAPSPSKPPPAASATAPLLGPKPAPLAREEKLDRSKDAPAKAEAQKAPAEPRQSTAASSPDPFPAANKTAADATAPGGQVAPSPPTQRSEAAARGQTKAAPPPPAEPYQAPPLVTPAPATAPTISALATPAPAAAPAPAPLAKALRADERAADDARARDRKPLPVPDWISLIRRLRAEGKLDEAAKELAAFRTAHPDHEKLLPPDLRDWRPPEK